jgi:hypothetical protein
MPENALKIPDFYWGLRPPFYPDPAFPMPGLEDDAMIKVTQLWATYQQQVAQAQVEYYKQVSQLLTTAKRR